jgi:hypothetical protein
MVGEINLKTVFITRNQKNLPVVKAHLKKNVKTNQSTKQCKSGF